MLSKIDRYFAAIFLCFALVMLTGPARAQGFTVQRCINMGSALEAPNEGDWGHTIDLANFARIRAAGFDSVRIPISWSTHLGPDNAIEPAFIARVNEVLSAALAADLSVILNIHHFNAFTAEPEANYQKFIDIWAQLSLYYKDLPPQVAFEVLNEPHDALKGDLMRRAQKDAVTLIRQSNPLRTIILGGENWSNVTTLDTNFITPDPNVVYTFHYYDPFEFTHQNAPWTGPDGPKRTKTWGTARERRALRKDMELAKAFAAKTGRALFLGEFGAYEAAPEVARLAYTEAVRAEAEAAGFSWCAFNFAVTFELFNRDTNTWVPGYLKAFGLSDE